MDMEDFKIRQGAQLDLQVEQGDETSVSATLVMQSQEGDIQITATASFEDGVANIHVDGDELDTLGIYDYQINENYEDGEYNIYPDANDCDDDCELPTIEICESLQIGSS